MICVLGEMDTGGQARRAQYGQYGPYMGLCLLMTIGETLVQSEPVPLDYRRIVAAVCCLLGSRRRGCEAQRRQAPVAQGNRLAPGRDLADRRGAGVPIASAASRGGPAFCRPLQYARLDRRCGVSVGLQLGD